MHYTIDYIMNEIIGAQRVEAQKTMPYYFVKKLALANILEHNVDLCLACHNLFSSIEKGCINM